MTRLLLTPVATTGARRRRALPWLAVAGVATTVAFPVVLFAGASNPPCQLAAAAPRAARSPAGARDGRFAPPLRMRPGRWYRVGATEYGGLSDPSSGDYGASGAFLPSLPNSFAELSVLDSNPANSGTFTFADADALDNLPYGTAVRVANGNHQRVLYKRDIGYGQGPDQAIPYRIDVWWQSASALAISKNPVDIQLAPPSGAAATLGQLPGPTDTPGVAACPAGRSITVGNAPLALTAGRQAKILPDGSASAPAGAPAAVKRAIAAANRIHTAYYRAARPEYLDRVYPWYDCSASTAFVLYQAHLTGAGVTVGGTDAGNGITLEAYGDPGPGKWISVYANDHHAFIVIAGRAFDTADFGGPDIPAGSGPRWRYDPLGNLADGYSYVVRHPPGL